MKKDLRKYNGGARKGSGRDKLDPQEKKQPLAFQVKKKLHAKARLLIQPLIDQINAQ